MSMSIARALTLRHRRSRSPDPSSASPSPAAAPATGSRGDNVRRMASVIDRSKISAPVELVSTTNMLSYNAPDIATLRKNRQTSSSASSASSSSGHDSDSSSPTRSSSELTDASSVDLSPTMPEQNHLSCYFQAAQDQEQKEQKKPRRAASSANVHRKAQSQDNVPAVPHRALSHSKSAHLTLARKRSVQTINSSHSHSASVKSTNGASSFREQARSSVDFFRGSVEPNHPFGKELEKLSEVAEELGGVVREAEMDGDVAHMQTNGLLKWNVDDYLAELRPLYSNIFGRNHPTAISPAWI